MDDIILWDWDNTLADTFSAILAAQNDMRIHFGLAPWTPKQAKEGMNASGSQLLTTLFGPDKREEARSVYLNAYQKHTDRVKLKDGAYEALETANRLGFCNILASNKNDLLLHQEVAETGLTSCFFRIIGAGIAVADKPDKRFVETALKGLSFRQLITIGDSRSDIMMARRYPHAIAILVGTDISSPEIQATPPDYACATLRDVEALLVEHHLKEPS